MGGNDSMHWVFKSDSEHGNVVFNFMHDPIHDLAVFAQGITTQDASLLMNWFQPQVIRTMTDIQSSFCTGMHSI